MWTTAEPWKIVRKPERSHIKQINGLLTVLPYLIEVFVHQMCTLSLLLDAFDAVDQELYPQFADLHNTEVSSVFLVSCIVAMHAK